jgi:EAL domain-containing protein (putative c-di-GMP-specific phosphodiesterase class I)
MRMGEFAGVGALVRWKHPELGLFQPAAFVPVMEGHDDYGSALINFSLKEAIACAGRWQRAGRELRVAINLSVRAFDRLDLPERIESLAHEAHVLPERITLEVTETQVARDAVRMIDVATRLRLKGFRLSIDDFGTGQSGLSKLQNLPFNEMKIDRSFVHGCSASATRRSVVEASLALARSLKMTSVAEGIQERPDWDLLDELGCDVMQGFFIGRPMSEEGLETWAAQWARNKS